jgi:hypothetical protein
MHVCRECKHYLIYLLSLSLPCSCCVPQTMCSHTHCPCVCAHTHAAQVHCYSSFTVHRVHLLLVCKHCVAVYTCVHTWAGNCRGGKGAGDSPQSISQQLLHAKRTHRCSNTAGPMSSHSYNRWTVAQPGLAPGLTHAVNQIVVGGTTAQ